MKLGKGALGRGTGTSKSLKMRDLRAYLGKWKKFNMVRKLL